MEPSLKELWNWCLAHNPLPAAVVRMVLTVLEEEGEDDMSGDPERLAAWLAPTAERMRFVARHEIDVWVLFWGWKNVGDAVGRWNRGESAAADAQILAELADPELSPGAETVRLAVARNGHAARAALRAAHEQAPEPSAVRVILGNWIVTFSGEEASA